MSNASQNIRTTQIVVRIPLSLRRLIEEHLRKDTHIDLSEFTREALREKIRFEAPELYKSVFAKSGDDPST